MIACSIILIVWKSTRLRSKKLSPRRHKRKIKIRGAFSKIKRLLLVKPKKAKRTPKRRK